MTELLKNAVALNTEEQTVEYSDELVRNWIDSMVDSYNQMFSVIDDMPNDLGIGELFDGSYENNLSVCGLPDKGEIHLYNCIDIITKVLGITPDIERVDYEDGTYNNKKSFEYRGYRFFQLGETKKS